MSEEIKAKIRLIILYGLVVFLFQKLKTGITIKYSLGIEDSVRIDIDRYSSVYETMEITVEYEKMSFSRKVHCGFLDRFLRPAYKSKLDTIGLNKLISSITKARLPKSRVALIIFLTRLHYSEGNINIAALPRHINIKGVNILIRENKFHFDGIMITSTEFMESDKLPLDKRIVIEPVLNAIKADKLMYDIYQHMPRRTEEMRSYESKKF